MTTNSTVFVSKSTVIKADWLNEVKTSVYSTTNVKVFGAVGDGAVDDTAKIQLALDEAGVVVFPTGTYLVTNLTVYADTTIIMHGATIIHKVASSGDARPIFN